MLGFRYGIGNSYGWGWGFQGAWVSVFSLGKRVSYLIPNSHMKGQMRTKSLKLQGKPKRKDTKQQQLM